MAAKKSKSTGPAKPTTSGTAQAPGPDSAGAHSMVTRQPPQSRGHSQQSGPLGAEPDVQRLNVAMRVLADPVARTSFSQPYSGQQRSWRR